MAPRNTTACSVCNHRERAGIELALARGVSMNALAKRYGIGSDSLYRHRRNHLPAQLRAQLLAGPSIEGVDLDQLRTSEGQSLLSNLVALRQRLFASLDVAEESGDGNMLARVAGQLHRNMELVGKLLGDLSAGTTINNNVLVLPAYVALRVELVRALQPFPEARQAVAAVLHRLESDSAKVIEADTRELAR